MFLVGAASGFFVSNVGWWGLHLGERDLERIHQISSENLLQVSRVESGLLQGHELFLEILKKQQLSIADTNALAVIDSGLKAQFSQRQKNETHRKQWEQIASQYARLSMSRERLLSRLTENPDNIYRLYATDALQLFDQLHHALLQLVPLTIQATHQAYASAAATNRNARNTLLALSLLATLFFCFTAWLTYRQAMEGRKKTVQLVREHALFKTLFDGTSDGIILLSKNKIIDCNDAALRLFAAPSAAMFASVDLSQVQPARQPDGSASGAVFRSRLDDHIASTGVPRFEWSFKSFEGKEFPAEVTINAARIGNDSIIQLMVRDITKRKETENSMRLANQAFENSLEGIAITDGNNNFLTVNQAFSTITGYAPEEVIGKNPSILSSGRQTQEFYHDMWTSLDEHRKWQGEIWNIRKNGDIYPQWLNISQLVDAHGKATNFVAVFSDISELKAAHSRILHSVYHDQLTDLPNRVLFTDRLHQLFALARRHPENNIAVMFMDLDRLKVVNDSMGREAGDQLLQMVAARLNGCIRESDTLARMNGDEFAILLSKITNAEDATAVAQKILHIFEEPFVLHSEPIHVSLSIGISVYPTDGADSETLLQNAAMAMYRAKTAGGICYELYDEDLGTRASKRMAIETGLRKAIDRNELKLHYQPQFECHTGKLIGFEALLRWQHPELGLLPPDAFLSIAEETGAIIPIGAWVLQTACAQAQAWRRRSSQHRLIAVNLSARQLQHPDIVKHVSSALNSSGLPAHCLELEITESMMMQKVDVSIAVMHQLSALGVEFSIDDFGTGYSSLAYLKKMPIKALKIDKSFIRDIVTDTDGAAIVSAIFAMSSTLGLRVVAEGIEDQAQLTHLTVHNGIIGQGYLLGRPVPAQAMTELIEENEPKTEHEAIL
ncbi:MAG: EAL domain-containing protein [Oxalobacteraceae bacterium]|nr:EAL domain-containing protein [Oxalobacteraceae bacterium]